MKSALLMGWKKEKHISFIEKADVVLQWHSRGRSSDVNTNNLAPTGIHRVVMTNEVFILMAAQVQEKQLFVTKNWP